MRGKTEPSYFQRALGGFTSIRLDQLKALVDTLAAAFRPLFPNKSSTSIFAQADPMRCGRQTWGAIHEIMKIRHKAREGQLLGLAKQDLALEDLTTYYVVVVVGK